MVVMAVGLDEGLFAETSIASRNVLQKRFRARLALAVTALASTFMVSAPAFALQVEGHKAFIVDRCGGNYDCKDAKLIVLQDGGSKADIYSGEEVNDHDGDGSPSNVSGYQFKYKTGNLGISQNGKPSQLNGKASDVKFDNGVAFESDKNYVYVYSSCNVDGAGAVAGITGSCGLNYVGVDKKTSNAIQISGNFTAANGVSTGPSFTCLAGRDAGQFSFLNNGYEYRLTSDLCPDGSTTLSIISNNVVKSSFDLHIRPLAGSN